MIGISSLLYGNLTYGDRLRYSKESKDQKFGTHVGHGPVVVWNVTRTCNLRCLHCYSSSEAKHYEGELTTKEALAVIDQLADFNVPVILFSGGEPFSRPDIMQLAEYAISKGIRVTFSTNGTLITQEIAKQIKEIGVSYVGISLDGIGEVHDQFRRKEGAFDAALRGIRYCKEVGQKVGLRFTINAHNVNEIPAIFDLIEQEDIPRVCFYHLVYSGRGSVEDDITHEQTREVINYIIDKTRYFYDRGLQKEILTVDNHADGIYLYLKMLEEDPERAEMIKYKLDLNGGNRTGIAVAEIDYLGNVHPDQFHQHIDLGNVKEQHFGDIWASTHPILEQFRDRKPLLKGRCASCKFLELCNGNFRRRAEAVHGDLWESDPQCYLTDEEIGIA